MKLLFIVCDVPIYRDFTRCTFGRRNAPDLSSMRVDPTRNWEMCCNACTSGSAPDDPKLVLGHSPVLIYRILNAGGVAIVAVGVGLAAFIISRLMVNDDIIVRRYSSGA